MASGAQSDSTIVYITKCSLNAVSSCLSYLGYSFNFFSKRNIKAVFFRNPLCLWIALSLFHLLKTTWTGLHFLSVHFLFLLNLQNDVYFLHSAGIFLRSLLFYFSLISTLCTFFPQSLTLALCSVFLRLMLESLLRSMARGWEEIHGSSVCHVG